MPQLLIFDGDLDDSKILGTRFGGRPAVPAGFSWPKCKLCGDHMQFIGQIHVEDERLHFLVFMCANDPGVCLEWEPFSGGNRVIVVEASGLAPARVPETGVALRPIGFAIALEPFDGADYESSRLAWPAQTGRPGRLVVGQINGQPSWLQGDETPDCPACSSRMTLLAQLEQGHDEASEVNFGGGCGYVFRCNCPSQSAAFLWQC